LGLRVCVLGRVWEWLLFGLLSRWFLVEGAFEFGLVGCISMAS